MKIELWINKMYFTNIIKICLVKFVKFKLKMIDNVNKFIYIYLYLLSLQQLIILFSGILVSRMRSDFVYDKTVGYVIICSC